MKQLSEFKNEQGVIIVAKLLNPISRIVLSMKDKDKKPSGAPIEFISSLLAENPKDIREIFAILSEVPPDEYECNAASLLMDTVKLAADKEFMGLFGLQSQTPTSSGSVSANTGDHQN